MDNDELWLKIEDRFNDLPCADRGERLVALEQHKQNGERQEDRNHAKKTETFGLWRVLISVAGLAILVLQIVGMVK